YSQLNPEWVQTYNGSGNGNDESLSHITDDSGNVYAAGKIFQTASLFDIYVVKYNVPGNKIWERIYNGPGNGNDIANSIALDLNGNIYVAGESKGDSTGGDFILIKYDGNGNEMWNRRFDGESSSTDAVIKVVTDNSGFPIVSGTSFNLNTLFDIVTIRYDPEGNIVWNKMYNGSSNRNEFIGDMAIDDSGNVFISGSSFVQGEGDNFLLIKYSNNGDQLWTADYNGPSGANDNITSLTLDNNGNAVISGSSVAPGTGIDFATLKYSGSGQELWLRRYSSSAISSPDEPKAIISDIHGNIFVTGASVQSNSYDYLTVKYSSSGDELWTRRYNGPSGNNFDEPRSLTTDISGNVFVAGLSQGTGTMDDMVIIKYDSTGNQIWLNRYNSAVNRNDVANNISIDISGNITVSGFIAGTSSLNDFAVVRFSQLTNLFQHYNQNATDYYLFQNYPNPFNPSTIIGFSIPSESKINLSVYNSLGKIVRTLQNGYLKPGLYSYKFNSSGLSGGIYFYTLKTDKQTITRKMLLIK
ncbi:MAG: SBBP repeat-containing protein, partial [Ignavibacteriae bacterium]|nr:SBBP repeat-containing protein [Ignavibacteriota bacterium]